MSRRATHVSFPSCEATPTTAATPAVVHRSGTDGLRDGHRLVHAPKMSPNLNGCARVIGLARPPGV